MLRRSTILPFAHGKLKMTLRVSEGGPAGDPQLQMDDFFQTAIRLANERSVALFNSLVEKFGVSGETTASDTFRLSILGKKIELDLAAELDQQVDPDFVIAMFAREVLPDFLRDTAATITLIAEEQAADTCGLRERMREHALEQIFGGLGDVFGGENGRGERSFSLAADGPLH